jgi:hypothetical protein
LVVYLLTPGYQELTVLSVPEDGESQLSWEELAKQLQEETDLDKIGELARKLNEVLIEKERQKSAKGSANASGQQNQKTDRRAESWRGFGMLKVNFS